MPPSPECCWRQKFLRAASVASWPIPVTAQRLLGRRRALSHPRTLHGAEARCYLSASIRVRWVERGGPRIEAVRPEQIEIAARE
jgi:hypothetical protein